MTEPSPFATPELWNALADGYVTHTMPVFERYAARALELAELAPRSYVLDVAAGPGTLALLAAAAGHQVTAVDFAPNMVESLRRRARDQKLTLESLEADGQALPFPAASFEAGFSMFGLMFFPDRAQGLAELSRVLRPEGKVVLATWTPIDQTPELRILSTALYEALPDSPFGPGRAPLGEPDELREELVRGGFRDVRVEQIAFTEEHAGLHSLWEAFSRGGAPYLLLKRRIGEAAWPAFESRLLERLARELGTGPLRVTRTANVGIATKR